MTKKMLKAAVAAVLDAAEQSARGHVWIVFALKQIKGILTSDLVLDLAVQALGEQEGDGAPPAA